MKLLRSLIVEDNADDELLLLRYLAKAGYDVQSQRVQTAADLKAALATRPWDIVISDYQMPNFNGLDALSILKESGRDIPFIIISGIIGEEVAVEAMRLGVDDYLLKGNLARLAPAIEREMENEASRRARQQAEKTLRESEERFRSIVETTTEWIWAFDSQGNCAYSNPALETILGYTPEEFFGKSFLPFMHEEDREKIEQLLPTLIAEQRGWTNLVCRWYHKDGSVRILESNAVPLLNSDGEVIGYRGADRDITERKRADEEKALLTTQFERQHERLNNIIANVAGVVWEAWGKPDEATQKIDFVSDYVEVMLGYTVEEWLTTPNFWLSIVHPEDRERMAQVAAENFIKSQSFIEEFRWVAKDGRTVWVETHSTVICDKEGQPIGYRGVNIDITEQKLAERLIKESDQRYRIVAESASDVIMTIDESSLILFANPAAEKIFGYKSEELIGNNLEIIVPERLRAAHRTGMDRYMQTGKRRIPWSGVELVALHRNGQEIHIEISFGEYHKDDKRLFTAIIRDITKRKRAEEALSQAEARYRNLVEFSPMIVYLAEPYPPYAPIYVSPNIKMLGYSQDEWYEKSDVWINMIHHDDREKVLRMTEEAMKQNIDTDLEYRLVRYDGRVHWIHDKGRFIADDEGNKIGWQGIILDITATKELEEQLRQAQKLESIGRLAGGIAHDFNNMLTAINGYSELTLRALAADNPLRRNIEEIKKAGTRSALLTHQLLAFSRRQVLQPVVLDLNAVITDTAKILERVIGEDVRLVIALKPRTGRVNVDPGQLSQIIMNLAVNARDAMPGGGTLTIETADVFLEPDEAKQKVGVVPGAYVQLSVCDTGDGMDENTRQHIFEPFFTTKEVGRGTGLGLATVYGIVKQSGGNIEVDSQAGAGTVFRIYLPRVAEQSEAAETTEALAESLTGTETILLVEDEELVRNLSREILESCGYTVIEAGDGIEALEVCASIDCRIDLLMTDVVMPRMGGRELAEKIKEQLPDLPILFTSGYTNYTDEAEGGALESGGNFIQKPFTFDALASKIRELLTAAES